MRKLAWILCIAALAGPSFVASAQQVDSGSLTPAQRRAESKRLNAEIAEKKAELAKLEAEEEANRIQRRNAVAAHDLEMKGK